MNLKEMVDLQRQSGRLLSAQFIAGIMLQIADGLQALQVFGGGNGNLQLKNVLLFGQKSKIIIKLVNYDWFPGSKRDERENVMFQNAVHI